MNGNGILDRNYICRPATELPSYMFVDMIVPENDEVVAGEVYKAEALSDSIRGNVKVYSMINVLTAEDVPVIVLNNGFETLADGRRPDGNPDYTTYSSKPGDVITGVRLMPEIKLELSPDAIGNLDAIIPEIPNGLVGTYLYPNGGDSLLWTKEFADIDTKVYLVVEAMKYFRLGGQSGSDFAYTMVVRVKHRNPNG